MLRQALEGPGQPPSSTRDESSRLLPPQRQQQEQEQGESSSSSQQPAQPSAVNVPLTSQEEATTTMGGYGTSHSNNSNNNTNSSSNNGGGKYRKGESNDEDSQDNDGSYDSDDDDEDDWSYDTSLLPPEQQPGVARRAWNAVRGLFVLVANVENLWDSPVPTNSVGLLDGVPSSSSTTNTNYSTVAPSSSSPTASNTTSSYQHHHQVAATAGVRRRSYLIVLFWFFILAGGYATERSTFKLLVDRAGPFRLFSVEMITGVHAAMLGLSLLASKIYRSRQQQQQDSSSSTYYLDRNDSGWIPLGVPLVDVGYMALLDTFHLLMVFLTGRYVCPTLTVILVQFTLPLSALLTQFVHTDGHCACGKGSNDEEDDDDDDDDNGEAQFGSSYRHQPRRGSSSGDTATFTSDNQSHAPSEGMPLPGWGGLSAEHLWGSLILTIAVVLALLPSFYCIIDPNFFVYADTIPTRTAYNTLLYVSSCFPAAASQLYKEHVFLQNKQPVNASYLNFLLSLFQFILATVMTPLVFGLQGLGAGKDWTSLYPSSHFSKNFLAGLKCFLGLLPDESAENDFPEPANCHWSLGLVVMHAFSIIAVGCAVDKIINAGATKAMYRGISAGIIVAVLLMYEYDMHIPRFNYGSAIDALNLVCLVLLIIGAEVYHRVSLSGSVFETVYPVVEGLYDDEV